MKDSINRWYRRFMVVATVSLLCISSWGWHNQHKTNNEMRSNIYYLESALEKTNEQIKNIDATLDTLRATHPYIGKKTSKGRKTGLCADGTFFGFLLYTPVDTTVCQELTIALSDYNGPKAKINSLRRHYNSKSQHFHGKAVDLAGNEEVISFLISEQGQQGLQRHNITFYIEGKPGSKRVSKYLGDQKASKFVFFNSNATADHIHLNV